MEYRWRGCGSHSEAPLSHGDFAPGGQPCRNQGWPGRQAPHLQSQPSSGAVVSLPYLLTVGPLPLVGWGGGEWGRGESSSLLRPVRRGLSEHHTSLSSTQLFSLTRHVSSSFVGGQGLGWEGVCLGMDGVLSIPPLDRGVSQQRKAHAERPGVLRT